MKTSMKVLAPTVAIAGLSAAIVGTLLAQGDALDRVGAVRDGMVEFHFASHSETCGDGLHWMRTGENSWSGSFINTSDPALRTQCERGPVRVLLTKADGEIVRIEAFVGPLQHAADATNLGPVGTMGPVDLVFLDPPYGQSLGEKALVSLRDGGWLKPDTVLVLEESSDAAVELPDGFALEDRREYGAAAVHFLSVT